MTSQPQLRLGFYAAVAIACAACGLRGPLYLPDEKQQAEAAQAAQDQREGKRPRRSVPAPQAQKKDRESTPGDTDTPISQPDPDRPAAPPTSPVP